MYETFASNLEKANTEESGLQKAYEDLIAEKTARNKAVVGFLAGSLHLPRRLWPLLLLCNGALTLASNAAQIMLTFRSKSTGQLSWITIGLRLAGTMVRMFTTLVLTDKDMTLFFLFAMGAALALAQAVQLTIYS